MLLKPETSSCGYMKPFDVVAKPNNGMYPTPSQNLLCTLRRCAGGEGRDVMMGGLVVYSFGNGFWVFGSVIRWS
jgi:hypothetical protein